MVTDHISVPISKVMSELTIAIHLDGVCKLQFRIWVAKCLFKLAARILGCNITVDNVVGMN